MRKTMSLQYKPASEPLHISVKFLNFVGAGGYRYGSNTLIDSLVVDGLWDPYGNYHMGTPLPISISTSVYRGTSLIRNSAPLGHYSRSLPRALWWSKGGGVFLMSEVPLYSG